MGGVVVTVACLLLLLGVVRRARQAHGGKRPAQARKDGFLASRRRVREMREKARLEGLRDEARHRHRLAEQEARIRAQASRAASGASSAARTAGKVISGTIIRLRPEKPDGDGPAPGQPGGAGNPPPPRQAPGTPPAAPPAGAGAPRPPSPPSQPQPPPAPAPAPANGGTTTVTTPAIRTGIEDLITAIDRIRARAVAGNAKAKLAALRACSAACTRFAQMAMMLAKQMGEQGHYGPEITERASAAGIHLTAAASAFSDSANALATLLNLRLGDVPESGRQAPHPAELSETGAR